MQKKNFFSWLNSITGSFKPLLSAVVYSPWLVLLYLITSKFASSLDPNDQNIIKSFIDWLGLAYVIFMAMVLANVWSNFDTIDREFEQEVDAIATLYQTANYARAINKKQEVELGNFKKRIHENIRNYVKHVITYYETEHSHALQRRNGERILESVGEDISVIASRDILATALLTELFRIFSEAKSIRRERISHARQRIPQTIWIIAIVFSLIWLIPFFALRINNLSVSFVLIGGITFVIVIILSIINDLANPFDGNWKIDITNWQEFSEILEPTPRIVFVVRRKNSFIDLMSRTKLGEILGFSKDKLNNIFKQAFFNLQRNDFLGNERNINVDLLYLDDLTFHEYEIDAKTQDFPVALLRIGEKSIELLSGKDIIANSEDFEKQLNSKLKEYFS